MENLRPTLNKLIVVINRSKLHLKTYDEKFCSRSRAAGYSFLSTESVLHETNRDPKLIFFDQFDYRVL